ncbi:MAG: hypothetical protein DWI21_07945 [Planctomycetota bacterium]|nr:MAG: hypothetical protein DWI21_07945 [Planctomycetota bacterium]
MIRRPRGAWRNRGRIASREQLQTSGAVDDVSGGKSTNTSGLRQIGHVLLCLCVAAWMSLVWSSVAIADEPLSVRVGYDQSFKVGRWTPIVVENASPNARACEAIVTDPDGVGVAHPLTRQVADGASSLTRWACVVRSGRLDGGLEVRVLGDGPVPLQHRRLSASQVSKSSADDSDRSEFAACLSLRQSDPVWLEIGTAIELLKPISGLHAIRSGAMPRAVEIPWALDGVDGIWVTSRVALSETARVELERWLRRGGHLVVTVATGIDEFQQTPWAGLLKSVVEPHGRSRTTDLSGIESFAVHGRKILGGNRTPVPITTLSRSDGQILAACLEGPYLTRSGIGFGLVTAIGIDPTAAPMSRWDGRTNFVRRLLLGTTNSESAKSSARSSLSQSGITDLASQWRAAAIHIPEIGRPTLWGALGLLLVYAAVIGPLDYLLVHKLLKRPHWTWASLPLLVAVASIGTVWLAHAANGDVPKLTQLDVVDIDSSRQEVVARSWATAYATENTLWHVEAAPTRLSANRPQKILSWLGFPENASGGMYRDSGFDTGHAVARSAVDRSSLDGIPIAQWSSKSLTSEAIWVSETPLIESQLTSTVAGELDGPVVHHLPFDLLDWVVVFDKWIYRPHPRAGEAATIWRADQPWTPKDERNYGRELRGFLQRTVATKKQGKKGSVQEDVLVVKERYNVLNLDPADILQMLTLHESAGGKSYTGLDHHSLHAFDVTPLLSLDRAIVIARVAEPTTEWQFNGEARPPTRHHGFVRFLLPVRRIGDASGFRFMPKIEVNSPTPQETEQKPKDKDSAPNESKTP